MSKPLEWPRTGFLPWIGERRSPIRQRKGVLENYQRAETTPHHAYTSILAICIKEIVSEMPQSSISPRLAQPTQQKRSSNSTPPFDIDPANTQIYTKPNGENERCIEN
jgi:hypothetical protein